VEVNSRALQLTAANAKRLGLTNVKPAAPEQVPEAVRFDGIWSNPPVRVGKSALHSLLTMWLARLTTSASAWLVVNRHLGGDSLAAWLAGEGWAVRRAASKSAYRVLEVTSKVPR
jgi:16S rRNA G1207 methylase RsmC